MVREVQMQGAVKGAAPMWRPPHIRRRRAERRGGARWPAGRAGTSLAVLGGRCGESPGRGGNGEGRRGGGAVGDGRRREGGEIGVANLVACSGPRAAMANRVGLVDGEGVAAGGSGAPRRGGVMPTCGRGRRAGTAWGAAWGTAFRGGWVLVARGVESWAGSVGFLGARSVGSWGLARV